MHQITTSEQINELSAALSKAQGKMEGAVKGSDNPFFKSRYADLASVWEAIREPLTSNGLSVIQLPRVEFSGQPEIYEWTSRQGETRQAVKIVSTVSVLTRLMHASGQWIESEVCAMIPSADPQPIGSAITYLKRYSLTGLGVAPEDDDDAERTVQTQTKARAVPDGYPEWLTDMASCAETGKAAFDAAWASSKPDYRNHLVSTDRAAWAKLKAVSAKVA